MKRKSFLANKERSHHQNPVGMDSENDNLNFYWNLTKNCLVILALWPLSNNETKTEKIIDCIHLTTISVLALQQSCNMLIMSYFTYPNFVAAAESMGPMMSLLISFGKICIYRYYKAPLRKLAITLEVCLTNPNCDEYRHLKSYMKYGNFASASVCCSILILITGYFSIPLILSTHELAFIAYFPWNWQNSTFGYIVSYSYQFGLTSVCACACSTEFSYVWSICHCCARLKVIQQKLMSIEKFDWRGSNEDLQKFISSIAKLHATVLDDIGLINTAYTYIVLLLFLAAIIAICCAGLTITGGTSESTGIALLFIVLAVYYAQQLLFYYLPGDLLAEQASAVGTAAYASGWERANMNCRRIIGLILYRSNTPPRLLVGNLSPLLLENYMSFLTTTASYFTSIRAVTEQ